MTDGDKNGTDPVEGLWVRAMRTALRGAVVLAVAVAAVQLMSLSMALTERLPDASQGPMQGALLLTALALYALMIATPFVPGVEIGVALLLLRGASIAPAVYLATLAGLILAFVIGRLVPPATLARTFRDLRLRRAAELITRNATLAPGEREAALRRRLPRLLRAPLTRWRYATLALLINLPGNAFLGGGGGLLMAAGLSRLFAPRQTLLTLLIAVLPVPLTIWWFGTGMLALSPD
ncbi:hypothetical protein [Gymnodinialimonas sp.]